MLFRVIVFLRWVRLTTRRYGFGALFTTYRPKRAGFGRGIRRNVFGRCHGWGTPALYIVRQLRLEREIAAETTLVLA
jgi:hypothetical protein